MNDRAKQIGFLTYDLQQFTEDCLYRISIGIQPMRLKAYPVISHPYQRQSRVDYLITKEKGTYLGVNKTGTTPEGFISNINWLSAWRCASESDIVVLFGLQGGTALVTAGWAKILGRRLISVNQTLPLAWERRRRWWVKLLKSWLLNRCDLHIYQTAAAREVLLHVYHIKETQMAYAPFEAGSGYFNKILQQCRNQRTEKGASSASNDRVSFLFVGNLHRFKGVADLIHAVALIPNEKEFHCFFAGLEEPGRDGEGTIAYYQDIAKTLHIEPRISFLGALTHNELASLYLASDVVVLPTHKDCFPKILVEGALAEKPLITTEACGAVGSLVLDGDNGFVVAPGDITALSDAMAKLFSKPLREKMGRRSGEIVRALCNPREETEGYVQALRRITQ